MRLALTVLCALLIASLLPASAESQRRRPSRQERRALRDLQAAQAAYRAEDYDTALNHLREAWAHFEAPVIRYNQGHVFEAMERWHDAANAYEIYLRLEGPEDDAERAELVERARDLRSRCPRGPCPVTPDPVPTEVPPPPPPPSLTPPIVLAGSGAGLLLGAGLAWGLAGRAERERDLPETSLTQVLTLDRRARRRARAGNVLGPVGGAVLAGAAVWLLVRLLRSDDAADTDGNEAPEVSLTPSGLRVRF